MNKLQVYIDKEMQDFFSKRNYAPAGRIAREMLKVMAISMQEELKKLNLTLPETKLILDALNGLLITDPAQIKYLWAEIEDTIKLDDLDKKWGVNGEELVSKLRNASLPALYAIWDVAQRFWAKSGKGEAWTDEEIEKLLTEEERV
ncbi:hypothetical protein [Atrimonas thermophila]|uniref:hypothetical protein n=1 Tax=Atrimonas thermophila TaxID=3064161 RepID=UPI00399C9382